MEAHATLPAADDGIFRLIYEEAVRAIDDQRSVLDTMRTRSGIVLSAAAVTTSFFGGLALRDASPGAFGWTAVIAFFVCGVAGLVILLPHGRWELRVSPAALVAAVEQAPPPIAVVHRDLALYWTTPGRRTSAACSSPWSGRCGSPRWRSCSRSSLGCSTWRESASMTPMAVTTPKPKPVSLPNPIRPETRGG